MNKNDCHLNKSSKNLSFSLLELNCINCVDCVNCINYLDFSEYNLMSIYSIFCSCWHF